MATFLRVGTTVTVRIGPFLDKADGVTEKTALTPVFEVSKNNGAFGARNSATAVAHDSNGWYTVELNTTDTGTAGPLLLKSDDSTTYLPVWREFQVVSAEVYDTLAGTDNFTVDLTNAGADTILKRDMSAVTGEAARSPLNALRFLRNKWSTAGGTLTVYKEDDATSAWTGAVTGTAGADPITTVDPA